MRFSCVSKKEVQYNGEKIFSIFFNNLYLIFLSYSKNLCTKIISTLHKVWPSFNDLEEIIARTLGGN